MIVTTMKPEAKVSRALPFIVTVVILVLDQLTKAWVVANIPQNTIYNSYLGDFISIWHVRNTAIGFSIGASLPMVAKVILFIVVPALLLVAMCVFVYRTKELTTFQRWTVAALIGGGAGNIIDRIFRSDWVVDFISLKVYGLFGFERWPTFNVADSTVVVAGILLIISILFGKKPDRNSVVDKKEHQIK
ncbi:MAG: signal peptidase II [Sphaerochaetaceae bacterium]